MNTTTKLGLGVLTMAGVFALIGGGVFAAEQTGTFETPKGDTVDKYQMTAEVISIEEEGRPQLVTVEDTDTGEQYTMPGGRYFEENEIGVGDTVELEYTEVPEDHPKFDGEVDLLPLSINGDEMKKPGGRGGEGHGPRGEMTDEQKEEFCNK